jgi:hypothetical protein
MQELEVDGIKYRTGGKLSAFEQFHVFRKLTPVISGLIESFSTHKTAREKAGPNGEAEAIDKEFWSAVGPVAKAISEMSKEDSEYVLQTCLKAVQRFAPPNSWVNLTTPQGHMMFEDVDLGSMLQLTYAVLEDNLGNFFRSGLANSSAAAQSLTRSSG